MTSPIFRLSRGPWFGFNGVYEFMCDETGLVMGRRHKGLLLMTKRLTEKRFPYEAVRLVTPTVGKRVQLKLGDRKLAS